jgi:hypothetical protein
MLKIRIEFLDKEELDRILNLIKQEYTIIDQGRIRESNREANRFKIIYIEVIKK